MNDVFFFDTYALIEVVKGNSAYEQYANMPCYTTKLNLFELYFSFIRSKQNDPGWKALLNAIPHCIDFDGHVITYAAHLKLNRKSDDLSMTDCIGYALAQKLGVRFLTGDKQFKDMPNVEFVK